jgi:uncharacterized protein YggE
MNAVGQRIAQLGIPKEAVRTLGIDLQQEFDAPQGRRVPRDFAARNTIEVRVDQIAGLGELLDAVVQSGATSVASVRFDLKGRDAAEREALRLAVVDARARADAAAAGAGRTIDRIVKIEDAREAPIVMARSVMGLTSASASAAPTPVEPGLIEIRAHVTLTATLK